MKLLLFSFLTLVFISCSSKPKVDKGALSEQIEQMRKRESNDLKLIEAEDKSKNFSTKIYATTLKDVGFVEGYAYLQAFIDDSIMTCYMYKERKDAATLLSVISKSLFEDAYKLTKTAVLKTDAGHFVGYPYLAAKYAFINEKKLYFEAEIIVVTQLNNSVTCTKMGTGYDKSFFKSVKILIKNLKLKDVDSIFAPPTSKEIYEVAIKDIKIGFEEKLTFKNAIGETVYFSTGSLILPKDGGQIIPNDTVISETSDALGSLIEGRYISVIDEKLNFELLLSKQKNGYYFVQGKYKDEDLNEKLDFVDKITPIGAHEDQALLTLNKREKVKLISYSPSLSPLKFSVYEFKKDKSNSYKVHFKANELKGVSYLTKKNKFKSFEFNVGKVTMKLNKIYVK